MRSLKNKTLLIGGIIPILLVYYILYTCLTNFSGLIAIISLITSYVCLFHWFKRRHEIETWIVIVLLLTLGMIWTNHQRITNNIEKGGYIISAKVVKLSFSHRSARGTIEYVFSANNKEYNGSQTYIDLSVFKRLEKGDTILIIYAEEDLKESIIYKIFPSKEEIQAYKNGVYYKSEQLYFIDKQKDSVLIE